MHQKVWECRGSCHPFRICRLFRNAVIFWDNCMRLQIPCPYCDTLVKRRDLENHTSRCPAARRAVKLNPTSGVLPTDRCLRPSDGHRPSTSDVHTGRRDGRDLPEDAYEACNTGRDWRIPCAVCGRKFAAVRLLAHCVLLSGTMPPPSLVLHWIWRTADSSTESASTRQFAASPVQESLASSSTSQVRWL